VGSAASLQVALQAARERAELAERALSAAAAAEREAAGKLEVLSRYRDEYLSKMHGTGASSIAMLLNARAFVAKLDRAVEAQHGERERLARLLAAAQDAWREARRRMKSVEILLDRRAAEEDKRAAKREQKLSDEFAARAARIAAAQN
jgi:flagellar FliJ protein